MFFDFHVHEDGRLVEEAERLGYSGVALFKSEENHGNRNNSKTHDQCKTNDQADVFETSKNNFSLKLQKGVEIRARNPEDMKRKVQKSRKNADVLMVYGGELKINRAACEDPRVDIISHPYHNRRDCGINHVLGRKAAENDVAVELNLRYLSKISSHLRYRVLAQFREILKLQRKFNFPLIITSSAHSIYDLHTPQDIIALSRCFGMDKEEAISALSETPANIMARNRIRNDVLAEGARLID